MNVPPDLEIPQCFWYNFSHVGFLSHLVTWGCHRVFERKPDHTWLSRTGRWVANLQSLFLYHHIENSGVASQRQNQRRMSVLEGCLLILYFIHRKGFFLHFLRLSLSEISVGSMLSSKILCIPCNILLCWKENETAPNQTDGMELYEAHFVLINFF